MDNDSVNREHIWQEADRIDGQPDPGWEKMEQAADQARQQYEQANPTPTGNQANPNQDVPEDERLTRPVGTESDSY